MCGVSPLHDELQSKLRAPTLYCITTLCQGCCLFYRRMQGSASKPAPCSPAPCAGGSAAGKGKLPRPGSRVNGFQMPWDTHQMASWVVFGMLLMGHLALYVPLHTDAIGIALTAVWGVFAIGVVFSCSKCCGINPCDPACTEQQATADDPVAAAALSRQTTNTHYCRMCAIAVHSSSKHCRRCDKCVIGFDHHCPWLNTCVGARNYKYFLALLATTFCVATIQFGMLVQASVLILTSPAQQEKLQSVYGMPRLAYGVLLVLVALLLVATWLLIVQLGTFHIALMHKGMTTFQFVLMQRDKENAEALARGDAPPSCGSRRRAWINSNAPCLAVCELCDEPPPRTSTSGVTTGSGGSHHSTMTRSRTAAGAIISVTSMGGSLRKQLSRAASRQSSGGTGSGRGGGSSSDKEGEQNAGHEKPQSSDALAAPATPPLGEPPHDPPRPADDDPAEEFTDDDERPQATTAADRI